MKKCLVILFIFFSNSIFAKNIDEISTIVRECIANSIESKYVYSVQIDHSYNPDTILAIYIDIYFKDNFYEIDAYFNNIIENKILIELTGIFNNLAIYISTNYPYTILLINNFDYDSDERQNIIIDVYSNTKGIYIHHISKHFIYGYFKGKQFGNSTDYFYAGPTISDNFSDFLEIICKYFGVGNIIFF
jgi:hypothetical protein